MAKKTVSTSKKLIATLPLLVAPSDTQIEQMEIDFHQNVLCASLHDEKQSILDWMYQIGFLQYDHMDFYIPFALNQYESWLYSMHNFRLTQKDEDIDWLASHPVYCKYFFFDRDKYRTFNFPYMNWFDTEALPDDDMSNIFSHMAEDAHADPELYN